MSPCRDATPPDAVVGVIVTVGDDGEDVAVVVTGFAIFAASHAKVVAPGESSARQNPAANCSKTDHFQSGWRLNLDVLVILVQSQHATPPSS